MLNREEAKKAIAEATNGHIISNYSAALVGDLGLIDELFIDFSARNEAEYKKMYSDAEYYKMRGGWDKFTKEENAERIDEIINQITAAGFVVDSVDFFDEANKTIFLNVTKNSEEEHTNESENAAKLLTLEEIKKDEQNDGGKFYAMGDNGRRYSATYSKSFGGVMFLTIPQNVEVLGYERRSVKTFRALKRGNYSGADYMNEHARANGYKTEITKHFETLINIDGKKYEFDGWDIVGDCVTVKLTEKLPYLVG